MEEKLSHARELMKQIDSLVNEAFREMNEIRDTNDISKIVGDLDDAAYHMMLVCKASGCARGYFSLAIDNLKND